MATEEVLRIGSAVSLDAIRSIGSIQTCPWDDYLPGTISFCEERLCSWIVEPANTWSNIGYLIVGILIAAQARKANNRFSHFFSLTSIYLFIGSSLFHATGTFFGQVLDLSAMFMLSLAVLSINLKRWLGWSLAKTYLVYVVGFLASVTLLLIVKPIGIPLFSLQMIAALGLERYLYGVQANSSPNYRDLILALQFFTLAFFFWVLDITGLACSPTNHLFTGHSAWHLLTAVTIYFFHQFYAPLTSADSARRVRE